jgi:hypothetical protein
VRCSRSGDVVEGVDLGSTAGGGRGGRLHGGGKGDKRAGGNEGKEHDGGAGRRWWSGRRGWKAWLPFERPEEKEASGFPSRAELEVSNIWARYIQIVALASGGQLIQAVMEDAQGDSVRFGLFLQSREDRYLKMSTARKVCMGCY